MQSNSKGPSHQLPATLVASPCVGLCSTTYGDLVCRGCMRHTTEITNWPHAEQAEKRLVTHRLDGLLTAVMPEFFSIDNHQLLQRALKTRLIPYDKERSPYAWLHKLLVRHVNAIDNPAKIGISVRKPGELFHLFQECRQHMYQQAQISKPVGNS